MLLPSLLASCYNMTVLLLSILLIIELTRLVELRDDGLAFISIWKVLALNSKALKLLFHGF